MICLSLVFLNQFWEGLRGNSFLSDPDKIVICACWELPIELAIASCFIK